ncbi:choice-of-anchor L domain-containing protein [Thiothrix unzii]|jgi:hypothetical protein|uniref:choice-of-anchor L domain-containing protein n=1 Tax=Thiothrix unzii TaxID=111769 RepID=UPI002A35CAD3|nr:choice-of-anchor L domain-containing protein [Thiothrix unzii]MDX9987033.1 choice-of-anchor L domain-containing protein [Thiothrix unzii]
MKIKTIRAGTLVWSVLTAVLAGLSSTASAGLSFNPNVTPSQMAAVLDGPGLSIHNAQITRGAGEQYGVLGGAKALLGFESGIFLTTGRVASLQPPNNTGSYSYDTPQALYRDADLLAISPYAKYDPVAFEFDIVPQGDRANFVFSFGSEEYPEFVCSQYNDAFGLFITGPGISGTRNAAFLPNTQTPIAVNNVNGGAAGSQADGAACQLSNTGYFIDNGNGTGSSASQLDGFTKTLTASVAGLQAGQVYHVKLAMADARDSGYDSGAAFKWLTSTNSTPVDLALTASTNRPNPSYNSTVELTWTVSNSSATATSLTQVGLEWPAGLTWLSDNGGGAYNPATGEWQAGDIPAGGSKSITIRAQVATAAQYAIVGEILYAFNEDPDSTPFNRHINANEDDTATVLLSPVANNAPTMPATATATAAENQYAVTPAVQAVDLDGDVLSYSISGGADAGKFTINAATGELRLVTPQDYENPDDADKNGSYLVQVTASDGKASVTQAITVSLTNDTTENALPVILPGNNAATHTQNYVENSTNLLVLDYDATDADGDTEGSGLTWLLTGGDDKWAFTIHPTKGWLEFTGAPDFERPLDADKKNTYEVQVTVCDSKGGCASQKLTVALTNVAEDSDGDGIPDALEIQEGIADPYTDGKDTDGDKVPDYLDNDDDGDGLLTQHEVADPNTDGDLADARDTDGDKIPDYLDADDDGDGKLTATEKADLNGDKNPADAVDSDDDGIPNYLDNNDEPSVHLSVRAYLQGAYNTQTGLMTDKLLTKGFLPKPQPFDKLVTSFGYTVFEGVPPFNHFGKEVMSDSVKAMPAGNTPVDWMLLELRDVDDPVKRVAAKATLLQRDGDVINAETGSTNIVFRGVPPGDYYVVLRHRNHIGVMTATRLSLTETATVIDFTQPSYAVYGNNQRYLAGEKAFLWAGDANNSNSVVGSGPGSDANIMLGSLLISPDNTLVTTHFKMAGYYATDLNLDGLTVFSGPGNDLNLLFGNIMVHPLNDNSNANFVIYGAVPR